jgi:hypothetical protein
VGEDGGDRVTLILRPIGRGNWKPVLLRVEHSKNCPLPLEFHVDQRVTLAGHVLRIAKVLP